MWDVMPCILAQNAIDSEELAASIFRATVNSSETLVIIYYHARNLIPDIILIMTIMKVLLKIDEPACGQMSVFFLMIPGCMIISALYAAP